MCKGSWRGAPEGLPFKRQKLQLSAIFQSRRLLPSRSRVTPSSRRKVHGDALRCRKRKNVRILGFEPWIFHFYLSLSKNPNTPQSPAATAPLFERGQPIGVRPRCRKRKNVRIFSFKTLNFAFAFSAAQRKDTHSHRLPPGGSRRGAAEGLF